MLAQENYFKNAEGRILTAEEYAAQREKALSKFTSGSAKVRMNENIKEAYRTKDSVVHTFEWQIHIGNVPETIANEAKIAKLVGKELPIRELQTIDNHKISLDDLKGKPVLISFWFTRCAPCIEEIPILNAMQDKWKDSVHFVAISFEGAKPVKRFLANHTFPFRHVVNAKPFIRSLDIQHFPTNIFLDRDGKVVEIRGGIPYKIDDHKQITMGDGKEFEAILRNLL